MTCIGIFKYRYVTAKTQICLFNHRLIYTYNLYQFNSTHEKPRLSTQTINQTKHLNGS